MPLSENHKTNRPGKPGRFFPGSETKEFLYVFITAEQDDAVPGPEFTGRPEHRIHAAVAALFLTVLVTGTLVISFIENGRFPLVDVFFEASSAMGTVGVSAVSTPVLQPASRAVLLPMMFFGRVGPLTLAAALAGRQGRAGSALKYPEERIMIG